MMKPVRVLITWDVDASPAIPIEDKRVALGKTIHLIESLGIASTFLFVAEVARELKGEISQLIASGQEIGCHGLTHGNEEDYDRMPEAQQRTYLQRATQILQACAGSPVRSFRGPRVKTSHTTQGILEELGYSCDLSVCSQRLDVVSSNLINPGWVFAPRLPYHPRSNSAFRRGERKIWVVPLSSMVLPFISTTLNVFKLTFMKRFFDVLHRESSRNGKPIVYLVHPFELGPNPMAAKKAGSLLKTIRTHGLTLRTRFYEKDEGKRYEMNRGLFAHMKSYPNTEFTTVAEYVTSLDEERPTLASQ
jgi:peptidoglycan/xylan/chitin deacetylase (PgdA/CDA1 family)